MFNSFNIRVVITDVSKSVGGSFEVWRGSSPKRYLDKTLG